MRFPSTIATISVILLGHVIETNAFWRMGCRSRTALVRLDPLVSPGQISEHMHAVHGSSATYEELIAGNCTSCEVAEDKSAYWHPALYFKDATTGKYELVPQIGGMLAYYLLNKNAENSTLSSFPAGFQMIAGDTNQRNFTYPVPDIDRSLWNQSPYNTQAFLRQAALGFNCLNYGKAPEGSLYRHFLPDKGYLDANCVDGVRFELMFPSCWNGHKEIPTNKMDHMAYPSQVMTGECPEGFPERLPSLFYETIWNTYAFKDKIGQFVISNGDPTGYGYHGDFIMGWDENFLRQAVNTCTNLSGMTSDCPLFTMQDPSVYEACNLKPLPAIAGIQAESLNTLDELPGNLPIQPGPGYAHGDAAGHIAEIPKSPIEKQEDKPEPPPAEKAVEAPAIPSLPYSAGTPMASAEGYAPGGIMNVEESPSGSVTAAPEINVQAVPTDSRSYVSIDYQTTGLEVVKVVWYEEVVSATYTTTTTVPPETRKRSQIIHYHRHLNRHHLNHAYNA